MKMTPNRHTVLRVVVLLLLVGIVAPFVVQAVPSVVGADRSYTVLSGSMQPAIAPGDIVVVNSVDPNQIEKGEIITYRLPDSETPTTHRVVAVDRTDQSLEFRTKGDANENVDPASVPAEAVVGEVMFVIPYIGYVTRFADTQLGFFLMVGVPFALLVLNELVNVVTAARSPPAETTNAHSGRTTTEDTTASTEGGSSNNIALTRTDLKLTAPVLVAFGGYSSYVAWQDPTAVSVAIATATASAAILVSGFYFITGRDESPAPSENPLDPMPDGGGDVDEE